MKSRTLLSKSDEYLGRHMRSIQHDIMNINSPASKTAVDRSSNFELLRIVCMLLIVCGHIVMFHNYETMGDSSWYIRQIIRPFTIVAVNVFILISGYFGIKFKAKKLWSLNWMVTFYTVAFLLIMIYLGAHKFNPRTDWMMLVPVLTRQYWFITIYFALCFICPFLNKFVDSIDESMYKRVLFVCFALFCIVPTFGFIFNYQSITGDAGYGLINFIFLYLLGRYISKYYSLKIKNIYYLFSYFFCMLFLGAFQIIYSKILGFDFDALLSYDTFFTFVGAFCFFMYFRGLNFTSPIVNRLAKPCLAVYVIHINPLFFTYLFGNILNTKQYIGSSYLIFLFVVPFIIYAICYIIDLGRLQLFKLFELK